MKKRQNKRWGNQDREQTFGIDQTAGLIGRPLTWVSRDSTTFELVGEDDGGAHDGEDGARLWQRQAATGGRMELTLAGVVASFAFTIGAG
jgi:hypothetical protein